MKKDRSLLPDENRDALLELRERVKELTCLYGIARLVEQTDAELHVLLQGIAELLPPAWQYPDITGSSILLDSACYTAPAVGEAVCRMTAEILVEGNKRGIVEVIYAADRPILDEGPFLKEERHLIDAVAREVGLIIARREADEERRRLQAQLLHAERLATIGQLAAGVAHELNEPLGNILGYAQLIRKQDNLPEQSADDIEKVVKASLHAREIIKKLMLFARQMPPRKQEVDLNHEVEESIYFLKSRCEREGIALDCHLAAGLPLITADPSQLQQVLVNLVVNAIQAMEQGGVLTVSTYAPGDGWIRLTVEDTGIGMSADVMAQVFLPFFTTKDVDKGTGLGLAVVHGIITAHGGRITVQSVPGRGTRFDVQLPGKDVRGVQADET